MMHVLVIDDEPALLEILSDRVSKGGHSVDQAASVAAAAAKLAHGDVDVALCDIKMPDGSGIDLVLDSRSKGIDTAFIMVTAFASIETAVEALRAGAFDYIIKPVRYEELLNRLAQIEALRGLRDENKTLRKQVQARSPVYRCNSPAMLDVERLAKKVARTDSTVLINGESGTGKGVLAHLIHDWSDRRERSFVAVNCSAIPEQLMETELFGHTKGAFTSADRARKGLFLEADRGTLFLDEIGELPLHMQTKLLNVIEDKSVRPVGSEHARHVDARIIVATNRDLPGMVKQGRFREDLFFRLSMFQVRIPPLRDRTMDVCGLIDFLVQQRKWSGPSHVTEIALDAQALLLTYDWPGNVRQLENAIGRARILAEGDCITVADLPSEVTDVAAAGGCIAKDAETPTDLRDRMRQFESSVLSSVINEAGGDRKLAARKLGISVSSLYRKLEEVERSKTSA
jgi:DNA-binding NtrC family response regulator